MTRGSGLVWHSGEGEMDKLILQSSSGGRAEVYRYGAHLTSWQTSRGKQWIFLSQQARFDKTSAIRGGIPVIFPQFNAFGDGPRHGFARNLDWQIKHVADDHVCLYLESGDNTKVWPFRFRAELSCLITDQSLSVGLKVINTDTKPLQFTCALHSYLAVDNLAKLRISGLQGLHYWDNDGSDFTARKRFTDPTLTFEDAIDRVFFRYREPIVVNTESGSLGLEHQGFEDIVVWNPGHTGAATMEDFGDDEYTSMVCIEAAQIDRPILLPAGETWLGMQTFTDNDV